MIRSVLESPSVYRLWQAPFASQKFRPVLAHGSPTKGKRVLDIGCGPGTNAPFFSGCEYVGLDLNEGYISYAAARYSGTFLARDVNDGLEDLGTFDVILMNSLMHHLDDQESTALLQAAAKTVLTGGVVHILDLVLPSSNSVARALARLDRGEFARPYAAWLELVGRHLDVMHQSEYTVGVGPLCLWRMIHLVCGSKDRIGMAF